MEYWNGKGRVSLYSSALVARGTKHNIRLGSTRAGTGIAMASQKGTQQRRSITTDTSDASRAAVLRTITPHGLNIRSLFI